MTYIRLSLCEIVIDEIHFDLNSLCGICSFLPISIIWYCIVFYVSCYTFPLLFFVVFAFIHCVRFRYCLSALYRWDRYQTRILFHLSHLLFFLPFGSDLFAFCLSCCHFFCIIRKPLKPAIPFQSVAIHDVVNEMPFHYPILVWTNHNCDTYAHFGMRYEMK